MVKSRLRCTRAYMSKSAIRIGATFGGGKPLVHVDALLRIDSLLANIPRCGDAPTAAETFDALDSVIDKAFQVDSTSTLLPPQQRRRNQAVVEHMKAYVQQWRSGRIEAADLEMMLSFDGPADAAPGLEALLNSLFAAGNGIVLGHADTLDAARSIVYAAGLGLGNIVAWAIAHAPDTFYAAGQRPAMTALPVTTDPEPLRLSDVLVVAAAFAAAVNGRTPAALLTAIGMPTSAAENWPVWDRIEHVLRTADDLSMPNMLPIVSRWVQRQYAAMANAMPAVFVATASADGAALAAAARAGLLPVVKYMVQHKGFPVRARGNESLLDVIKRPRRRRGLAGP